MKALTTILAERATAKHGPVRDGLKLWRDTARPHVAEDIVDACPLSRPGTYSGNVAARQFGVLGQLAVRKHREHRAGGLPQHFLLVVTADEVVILEHTFGGRHGVTGTVGGECLRVPRATLGVTWQDKGPSYEARLESPALEGGVECQLGRSPLGEDFLKLLADPARQTPAAG